ncbi:AAA family ATPase [Phyllobacterium sp. 21LDTY02-6]|uniref:AAA family ATPase n=1 Tax=Phyllobacterium sp. 21LDTY02-6 TaxID=2944903 RepID=UPI00202081AB|nr:AAA family ATPase [Phyllobacterium sp. 21LDTY02-6]MCO4317814.1 AAA family ATPase [Phyllobacterium sp. 21LDTY02-6]
MPDINDFVSSSIDLAELVAACENYHLPIEKLAMLLDARRRFEGSGNRRPLFNAFDTLLADEVGGQDGARVTERLPAKGLVSLRQVSLRNWKVFGNTTINLPGLDPSRPVILIGGKNGYGKTSLLEGILFCLFGKSALSERSHFLGESSAVGTRGSAYRQFIQNSFHQPAKNRGETSAAVRTEWETPEGILVVERRWYFNEAGAMEEDGETLTLYVGEDGNILPAPHDVDTTEFYQAEVDRRLMTVGAAFFFLFDAEQTSTFSERNLDEQVLAITESAFGLWRFRAIVDDLRSYSRDRARRQDKVGDDHSKIVSDLLSARNVRRGVAEEIESLGMALETTREKRDASLARLMSLQNGGTYESMHELLEQRQSLALEHTRAVHAFAGLAATTLPVALVGKKLRDTVMTMLNADDLGDDATGGVFQNDAALRRLLDAIEQLGGDTQSTREDVSTAWNALSKGVSTQSDALQFPHLTAVLRKSVTDRLRRHEDERVVLAEAGEYVSSLAAAMRDTEAAIDEGNRRDDAIRGAQGVIAVAQSEVEQLERSLSNATEKLTSIEAEIDRLTATLDGADAAEGGIPGQRRPLDQALNLADKIELVTNELLPGCFEKISEKVTEIYGVLAHKGTIARIVVASDGHVSLFDHAGQDVRSLDRSAGERQIFAMALIAAVGQLSAVQLPSIVDTPLGRLDSDHRERLLRYFSTRAVQTILLSQPEEINGRYLEMIRNKIGGSFILDHRSQAAGIGNSVAKSGYFDEAAA